VHAIVYTFHILTPHIIHIFTTRVEKNNDTARASYRSNNGWDSSADIIRTEIRMEEMTKAGAKRQRPKYNKKLATGRKELKLQGSRIGVLREITKPGTRKTGQMFFFLLSSDGLAQYCLNVYGSCTKQHITLSSAPTHRFFHY